MLNISAYFDALHIVKHLNIEYVGRSQIHLYSYLSCLLYIYDGKTYNGWGYLFSSTSSELAYSPDLDYAIEELVRTGVIVSGETGYKITDTGEEEYNILSKELSLLRGRERFLKASCGCILTLSNGMVQLAIKNDPQILSLPENHKQLLLQDNVGLSELYEQFALLKEVLPSHSSNLLVPATVWIQSVAI